MEKINKKFKKIINYIINNILELIFLIILICFNFYDTGYSIYKPGGIIDISSRITGNNINETNGSLNMAYVGYKKGYAPAYLLAKIIPSWTLVKNSEITLEGEELTETLLRDKLDYKISISDAIYSAFKESNKEFKIINQEFYIYYLTQESQTDLKVGDKIISYDNNQFEDFDTFKQYINTKQIGDKINIEYIRNDKTYEGYFIVYEEENNKYVGASIVNLYDIESDYNINITTKSSESGPSAGMMISLSVYNAISEEDIIKGRKIVGTGTIDKEGNIGAIGGVNYKLASAVKEKADIFICSSENYEEVKEEIEKNNYDIQIISVSTLKEAIDNLKK